MSNIGDFKNMVGTFISSQGASTATTQSELTKDLVEQMARAAGVDATRLSTVHDFAHSIERVTIAATMQALTVQAERNNVSLHNAIMNLPCEASRYDAYPQERLAYKLGHRDARHAAAELVNTKEAVIVNTDSQAVCRGCGQRLNGSPYWKGGSAYVRRQDGSSGERAKANYYGGWVCSRQCDYRASLELEQDMPGYGYSQQQQPGREAMAHIDSNWPE